MKSMVRPARDRSAGFNERYWDPRLNGFVKMIQPGEFAATDEPALTLGTLLGSCVSACICDPVSGIGGLNHFLLPQESNISVGEVSHATRYGVHAMEMLINQILKLGGERARLQAKIFGGANVISLSSGTSVGDRNQEFACGFLAREGIPITASELGGESPRRIYFQPSRNKVFVLTAGRGDGEIVQQAEVRLQRISGKSGINGDVELF